MAYGAVESYQSDELVVALPDFDIVHKALTDLQVAVGEREDDERLGLARLPVGKVAEVATELRRQDDGLVRRVTDAKWWSGGPPQETNLSDLDVLLYKLRENFSAAYGGWLPDIGKNRVIAPVRGFPHLGGCTIGDPSQLGLADPQLTGRGGQGWRRPRATEPGHGVRVGLLDTKLYPNSWLEGGYLAAKDGLLEVSGSDGHILGALEGHGTFVAGLILDRAPGARLIVRPVMGPEALGTSWNVAKVMAQFVGTGVDILNLSFGCYTDDGRPPLVLAKAVSLVSPEILLVAAAGNHGDIEELRAAGSELAAPWTKYLQDRTPVWPAAFAEVTAVGATDKGRQLAKFTPMAPWVDVTAPGVHVESTYLEGEVRLSFPKDNPPTKEFGGFARWDGTSFAAATVSGAIAAKIGPGRDARQALEAVLADPDPNSRIWPFSKSEAPETQLRSPCSPSGRDGIVQSTAPQAR